MSIWRIGQRDVKGEKSSRNFSHMLHAPCLMWICVNLQSFISSNNKLLFVFLYIFFIKTSDGNNTCGNKKELRVRRFNFYNLKIGKLYFTQVFFLSIPFPLSFYSHQTNCRWEEKLFVFEGAQKFSSLFPFIIKFSHKLCDSVFSVVKQSWAACGFDNKQPLSIPEENANNKNLSPAEASDEELTVHKTENSMGVLKGKMSSCWCEATKRHFFNFPEWHLCGFKRWKMRDENIFCFHNMSLKNSSKTSPEACFLVNDTIQSRTRSIFHLNTWNHRVVVLNDMKVCSATLKRVHLQSLRRKLKFPTWQTSWDLEV